MSTTTGKCSICQKSLGKDNKRELTTVCGHTFHRECAQQRLTKGKSKDCPICRKETALADAFYKNIQTLNNPCDLTQSKIVKNSDKVDRAASELASHKSHSAGASEIDKNENNSRHSNAVTENNNEDQTTMRVKSNDQNWNKQENTEWDCDKCGYHNESSAIVCMTCKLANSSTNEKRHTARQSNRTLQPIDHSPSLSSLSSKTVPQIYPGLNDESYPPSQSTFDRLPLPKIGSASTSYTKDMNSLEAVSTTNIKLKPVKDKAESSTSSTSLHQQRQVPVYISDLPLDIEDDNQLASLIRHRVETALNIEISAIKCYSKLGIGVMHVSNQIKDHLINHVVKLFLHPKKGDNTISFVDALELVSYIVINMEKEENDLVLPTPEEITRRWMELHKGGKPLACDQLNIQFPNIYRLVSASLDELLSNNHHQDFKIKSQIGQIYFCADCSFLEDVPRSTTQEQLQAAIAIASKLSHISSSSLYIQINKQTGNACILATGTARKWSQISYIYLDGKPISKKDNLTCLLLISPVPQTFSIQTIINHQILAGKVIGHKHSGENLILEISDKNVFDDCVKHGDLRVGDKSMFHMEVYVASKNPEESEIDANTWYATQMSKYKPDIMQFIVNPEHSIFRYKWNAKIWLEQWLHATPSKHSSDNIKGTCDQKGTILDQLRHQLQVTVMLNTLGTVHKKRYLIGDREVKLNLNNKLKTIVYNHQSKLEKDGTIPLMTTPYPKTTVSVVKDDCIAVCEKLLKKGKRPLLLNMASATSPGGGFRKGDGAQEENLFRRSDYFRSLDIGLDDFLSEQSSRVYCSSNGQFESLSDPTTMYPMDEYGAIYTSGLTFFRHSQDTGYDYMEKPLENVCAVAMAAYRDPKLEENWLAPKYAVGTRKKIENIFAIAYYHKHDSLVLSAFGCGAFHNPPIHVAKLFSSVIDQYAGFFETIIFAIVDDHNAGQRLNPEGNFKPFVDLLNEKSAKPMMPMNKANTMFGPYRLSSDGLNVADVYIFDSTPCNFGAKCSDINNPNHTRQFSHPPCCPSVAISGKCDLTNDIVHMISFLHRNQCQYGGECRNIDNKKHAQEFEHPSYCKQGATCEDMEDNHLKEYRHLPLCKDGKKCMDYQKHVKKHCDTYRHCIPRCSYGNHCTNFHNRKHTTELQHPFPTACPRTPFHCPTYIAFSEAIDIHTLSKDIHQHCLEFAHVCRFGRNCTDNTSLHLEKSIHIARCLCPYGDKCIKLNQEEHLNSYTHPDIVDIRRMCKYADKCHDRKKLDHSIKFRHAVTYEDSGVVRYDALNKSINFVQNQNNSIARILDYVKKNNWQPLPSESVPREILDWFHTVQPVHRCNPIIFESILLHGHVMSRDYMEHLKKPIFVANSVMQHSRIRRIDNLHIPQYEQHAREYITAIVSAEYAKANFPPPIAPDLGSTPSLPPRPISASHINIIKAKEKILLNTIPQNDLTALKSKAIEIAQASIKLHSNPAGIGHAPDKALGTDKHVFSVLGPHLGHYYGDVFIVFKREILHHPDADFSIQAATSFISGNTYKWRPWLGDDPGTPSERVNLYHNSKLHASIPGYDYAIALELIALTSYTLKSKSLDIDLNKILKRYIQTDSHQNIEAHLPQLIPLDYIDHIYIPQNIFDSLNSDTRKAINAVFKTSITVTPHQGEANQPMGPFGPTPTSKERADYQTYVVAELFKRYDRDVHYPPARPIQGTIITIPGTNFDYSFVLPLTISQAYEQYRIDHHQSPNENIAYIYWQVMNGDMMLALSNEPIELNEKHQPNLRCLICYIAPKCVSYDTTYYEQTTYLNCGQPIQHHAFVSKNEYKAKSNRFHIGCNIDDFITYCLEIHRSTGKVILRQAGSNSIYNHEEISCEFSKTELDLAKLEFIHVTAGVQKAAIRNLIACFEKQKNLHPTFDKDFKKSVSIVSSASHVKGPSGDSNGDSSSLDPCPDNINCLLQYATDRSETSHNSKFSHPCRFSELCRNKEPHLTHDIHPSSLCTYDKNCNKLTDPFHRAEYRHTNLPDFLVPCRNQTKCQDKSNRHRIKYSHGEKVFGKTPITTSEESKSTSSDRHVDHRTPCKYGSKCKTINDPSHKAKYSHPKSK
ncbi:unnamed protein product [Rotaria sp. Silwood2]|nr:unnamed protein product [Rotaria sp. Silwood2]CAF4080122.1 unnamed protein product [Rotaria sp. Silwood2]